MSEAVIVSAVRTPVGAFMGGLSGVAATRLGAIVVADAVRRAGIESDAVDEVLMGNVLSAGLGQNPARQAALQAGIPESVPIEAGVFDREIVPVSVPAHRGDPVIVDRDEHPRADTTLEGLARLRPAFAKEGTVTAGSSSGINDGAAATVVMSAEAARDAGVPVLATIRGYASVGVAPRVMGLGPVGAVQKALARAGVELGDIDVVELNEAFAAQSLAVSRRLGLDPERTNVHGGAIALGIRSAPPERAC